MANLKGGLSGAGTGAAIGSAIPGLGTAIGAGIGGLIGLFGGGDDDHGAAENQRKALEAIKSLNIDDLSKQIMLEQYQTNGRLDPEMIQHLNLNADTKNILTEAPENRANQQYTMDALKQMSQTGMSPQDLAQMQASRSAVAGDTAAKTNQLLQQSQMRGTLGGGDTLAAQLMANQSGSQQASKDALNTAAAAAQARQQALMNYGNMSSEVRGQDYATQQANMQNELSRQKFLDENSLGRQTANVGAQNNANMYNLQRQQTVGDTNVGAQNAEKARSANLRANLTMQKATGLAGIYGGQAAQSRTDAANEAKSNSDMWGGVTKTVGALGNAGTFDFMKPGLTTEQKRGQSIDDAMAANPGQRYAHGGEIDGPEMVDGDSYENDVVPILASGGEFMIPKTKMKDADSAKDFIDQHFGTKKEPSKHEHLLDLIAELHGRKSKE